ncbi:ADP-glucose phosphorylase isoform X2 [Asparagus officinalis]|uniref:ADP-glucose phosphorylase isoform X2 n=1 Tax=Asparagus officinalis TaxID=4686 RepID=UPI00098E35E0|nr:ADP-glucose phosphorylase isoform X2 [Asparagus officinalis]
MSSSSSRSPELRRDSIFNRWVIFSPARSRRPSDFKSHSNPNPKNPNPSSCPFCIGHESECAPEIFRFPKGSSNWKVRVIENLYPALKRDEGIISDPERLDPKGCVVAGFGFHDVVIESTTHSVHLPDLSEAEVGEVVRAYKERILQLKRVGSVKYVQVFKNHGASAGASLTHSHSQMIGLPIVPPSVSSRLKTTYPFEIWIVPRDHTSYFHDIDEEKVVDFGGLLKLMLLKMSSQLNDPPYNFMIHTAPFELPSDHLPCAHWFLQIVPQLGVTGGFEMGSGCYINPVFPEDAANILREVDCSQR